MSAPTPLAQVPFETQVSRKFCFRSPGSIPASLAPRTGFNLDCFSQKRQMPGMKLPYSPIARFEEWANRSLPFISKDGYIHRLTAAAARRRASWPKQMTAHRISRLLRIFVAIAICVSAHFDSQVTEAANPRPEPVHTASAAPPKDPMREWLENQRAQSEFYKRNSKPADKNEAPWWGLWVLSLLSSVLATGATLYFTDLSARHKAEKEEFRLYSRQKAQVRVAVRGLRDALQRLRLDEEQPAEFLRRELLSLEPEQPDDFHPKDPYYQKYYLVHTVYRLCALLGWLELYRIDPTFLSGPPEEKKQIERCFQHIREALSEETKAEAVERDGVILEDDQRAIGEKMLATATKESPPTVIGYAAFCEQLFRVPGERSAIGSDPQRRQDHWIWNATGLFVAMSRQPTAPDRRKKRLQKVLAELGTLQPVLEKD
jgi:hypothetical protein